MIVELYISFHVSPSHVSPSTASMLLKILFLFSFITRTSAEPTPDLLDHALRAIKMSREDITFDVEYRRRDPFALNAVDDLIKHPLKLPDYTQDLAEDMANAATLRELIELAAQRLEVKLPEAVELPEVKRNSRWERKVYRALPEEAAGQVVLLVRAAETCSRLFEQAYENLSKDEVRTLTIAKDTGEKRKQFPLHEYYLRHHRGVENVERANKALFRAAEKFQLDRAFKAAALWAEAVEKAKLKLKAWKDQQKELEKGILLKVKTPAGLLIVTGWGSETIDESPAILIDFGGDDTWLEPLASGKGCTAAIELGGDDRYIPKSDYACGVGIHGVGILIDCDGDDRYYTNDMALGVGLFGVGLAVDESGRDEYNTQEIASGVGAMGIGIQIDLDGHDTYTIRRMGQAASVTRGFGLLLDRAGNDTYFAGRRYGGWSTSREFSASAAQGFAGGIREYTSGGIALLLDLTGNDTYFGEAIAQGVGYWFAAGMLVDGAGNDTYHAIHYSQGSAFHFAVGGLFDNGGNDVYLGRVTCQGSGYDYSAGFLVDFSGNDLYRSNHLSSGSGGVTGMGFLFDNSGDDHYLSGRNGSISLGGGQFVQKRGFGCIGVFIDFNGRDQYTYEPTGNNTMWTRPADGVGLDVEKGKPIFTKRMRIKQRPKKTEDRGPEASGKELETDIGEQIENALKIISNWRSKGEQKEKAVKTLKTNLGVAEPKLIDHLLAEPFYMSFGGAYAAIPEIGVEMVPSLIKVFNEGDAEDRVRAVNMLGRLDNPKSIETLLNGLKDENYRVRGSSALGLSRLGHMKSVPQIIGLLKDPNHTCRTWAAMALGRLKAPEAGHHLVAALTDTHYSVRSTAVSALIEIGEPSLEHLRSALEVDDPVFQSRIIETFAAIASTKAGPAITKALSDSDWLVRASACRAAATAGLKSALEFIRKLSENDPEPHVRLAAKEAVEILEKQK